MLRKTCSLQICMAICVSLLIGGCAALPTRIQTTHLTCSTYPELVDGNLATKSILKVQPGNTERIHYGDWLEGGDKAEVQIQLDTLTPVSYIRVHPVSRIYRLSVETATEAFGTAPGKVPRFEPVKSHKIARSENGEVIHLDIDRPVRILRVFIHANRDLAGTTREPLTQKVKVAFEPIIIREIRVYQQ